MRRYTTESGVSVQIYSSITEKFCATVCATFTPHSLTQSVAPGTHRFPIIYKCMQMQAMISSGALAFVIPV